MRYAKNTKVAASRSRDEIERIVTRYGASGFAYAWKGKNAMVSFMFNGLQISHKIEMPDVDDPEFTQTPTGRYCKSQEIIQKKWEQATRQKWRALALVVKAKLEAIDSGISSMEDEFLAWIVTPDGKQIRDHVLGYLDDYRKGNMPKLLMPGVEK